MLETKPSIIEVKCLASRVAHLVPEDNVWRINGEVKRWCRKHLGQEYLDNADRISFRGRMDHEFDSKAYRWIIFSIAEQYRDFATLFTLTRGGE